MQELHQLEADLGYLEENEDSQDTISGSFVIGSQKSYRLIQKEDGKNLHNIPLGDVDSDDWHKTQNNQNVKKRDSGSA